MNLRRVTNSAVSTLSEVVGVLLSVVIMLLVSAIAISIMVFALLLAAFSILVIGAALPIFFVLDALLWLITGKHHFVSVQGDTLVVGWRVN